MNVDRIGLMEKITVLHTGIVRAVRVLTIITVKAGMATTVRGAMVIVVHLMATEEDGDTAGRTADTDAGMAENGGKRE